MRSGHLIFRPSHLSTLPSFRPTTGVLLYSYSPSSVRSSWRIQPIYLSFSAASSRSSAEWKKLRLPLTKIPAPLPFPLLSGFCLRNLCSPRASQASDSSASIDSNTMKSMETKIKEQLNADVVTVKDAYGDGRHVSIDVVSAAFEGQSAVNRQRMVYKTIWEELQSTVHAVDHMSTRTPAEAAENQ